MKIKVEGHVYELENFENKDTFQTLSFIHKVKDPDTFVLSTVTDGTTNEEVIKVLIDRLGYLNGKMQSSYNEEAILHLKLALEVLEKRTADRVEKGIEGTAKTE